MIDDRRLRPLSVKVTRFALVGIVNTAIDFAVFGTLVAAAVPPLVANVLSWSVAVLFSFAANSLWTFERDSRMPRASSLLRFVSLGALVTLAISTAGVYWLTGLLGVWPAKLIGTGAAAILNFLAARWSIEGRLRRRP